jgi:hypothetical protein
MQDDELAPKGDGTFAFRAACTTSIGLLRGRNPRLSDEEFESRKTCAFVSAGSRCHGPTAGQSDTCAYAYARSDSEVDPPSYFNAHTYGNSDAQSGRLCHQRRYFGKRILQSFSISNVR